VINARRGVLGSPAVDDVRGHIFGERPLLAADPVVGPWDGAADVVLRGWTGPELVDEGGDCLSLGEVNQQALFPRVTAVVHHGGAGTTTAAALGGAPQVVVPQLYDQFSWGERGGRAGDRRGHPAPPTPESLVAALGEALQRGARAREVAGSVRTDVAARLVARG